MTSVCVHGLGYVGLPTAAMLANHDHTVYGYDIDDSYVGELNQGRVPVDEPGLRAFVREALESGNLTATTSIPLADYHIITVPTPFDHTTKCADLSYIEAAGEAISENLRHGDAVILESTAPPETTEEVLLPILEQSGVSAGDGLALSYSPETVLPGNIIVELKENDRIIGGINTASIESSVELYETFVSGDIHTTNDVTTAEFVKLIQNTYRDVNIALANELAKLSRDYGIDSREAIKLANEHPRVNIHHPGPGVGGHCLPVDPWFLGHDSDELHLIESARNINDSMTDYIVELLQSELGTLEGTNLAVLGVAYKGNVDDARNSPGLKIARRLQAVTDDAEPKATVDGGTTAPVNVRLTDPYIDDQVLDLQPLNQALNGVDSAVITTDHDEYADLNPGTVSERMDGSVIVDTKAVLDRSEWAEHNFTVVTV